MRVFEIYKNLLVRFPLGMQAVQAGTLMGIGDQIAQNFVEKRPIQSIDIVRTAKFICIGFFIAGPATRKWYGVLDNKFGSKGIKTALKKVAFDQLLFAPTFIFVLLSAIGILQGASLKNTQNKVKDEYTDILMNNYKVWPLVQVVNFSIVPLQYQVLVVQFVAILWNTYISYRTNKQNYTDK